MKEFGIEWEEDDESDAKNMWALAWDDDLAKSAQDKADSCHYEDPYILLGTAQTACDGTEIGQLFYWQYRVHDNDTAAYNVGEMVKKWESEKQDYNIRTVRCDSQTCYNYTQVVWAETKRVGCGIAYCESVTGSSTQRNIVFVCSYSPKGNIYTRYGAKPPYIFKHWDQLTCVACLDAFELEDGTGGYRCDSNLCYSCRPKDDPDCKCSPNEWYHQCHNGGTWDEGICECSCPVDFVGENCEISCKCTDKDRSCWSISPEECNSEHLKYWLVDNCSGTCTDLCVPPPACTAVP